LVLLSKRPTGNLPALTVVQEKLPKQKDFAKEQWSKVTTNEHVRQLKTKATEIQKVTDRTQAYSKDVQNLATGHLGKMEELPSAVEAEALKLEGMDAVQEELFSFGDFQGLASQGEGSKALKELAKQQLLEVGTDHFASQHQALQSALSVLKDAKQYHSSLASLRDLRVRNKLFINSLQGRPFKERFSPGLMFQVLNGNDTLLVHTYPTATYKVSGAISVGLGGYYRVVELKKEWKFAQQDAWWGIIAYTTVRFAKSVHLRLEADAVNATSFGSSDRQHRYWTMRYLVGLQKEFRLSNRFTGNALFLHSFENKLASTIPEKLQIRISCEYRLTSR
jgi:hypothetical protein